MSHDPLNPSTAPIPPNAPPDGPTERQWAELRKAIEAARRHAGMPPDLQRLVNAAHAVVFEVEAYREHLARAREAREDEARAREAAARGDDERTSTVVE